MPKRTYKVVDGKVEQTDGPLYEGPKQTIAEMIKEGLEEAIAFEKGDLYASVKRVKAPSVVIPKRHRSAG